MSEAVHDMFSEIAPKYDRANSVLSLGVHHAWRSKTVKASGAQSGMSVLDCATGTGDLALAMKKAVGPTGRVVGTDFNADMLSFAPAKAQQNGLDVDFSVADVLDLPFEDNSFDVSSIAFGIRNVDDPVQCLREMSRVVKPGGRVVVLEFGQPNGLFGAFYRWYSKNIIPRIGGMITGNRDAYDYLPETSAAFPCGDDFTALMDASGGFQRREYQPLTGGIAFLYTGVVK